MHIPGGHLVLCLAISPSKENAEKDTDCLISLICGIITPPDSEKEIRLAVTRGGGWGEGPLGEADQKVHTSRSETAKYWTPRTAVTAVRAVVWPVWSSLGESRRVLSTGELSLLFLLYLCEVMAVHETLWPSLHNRCRSAHLTHCSVPAVSLWNWETEGNARSMFLVLLQVKQQLKSPPFLLSLNFRKLQRCPLTGRGTDGQEAGARDALAARKQRFFVFCFF